MTQAKKGVLRRKFGSGLALIAASHFAIVGVAHADVASEMNGFFNDAGGAANVTGPTAFQGQSAGYYSLGNVWTRFPQKSVSPFNLQLPSARAGCGGIDLFAPVRIDADVLARLQAATAFAPLHGPASLRMIALAQARYPGVPQIACFDTGFHASLPAIAATLPIPKALRDAGVRRYGFHGLSCESILAQLGDAVPHRLIIAHLGNGASVTAVLGG